jgi:DNA modification methylase
MGYLLINGDSRRLPIDLATVDAVVTDPPYGQSNEAYDNDIAFRPEVWRECFRVAKPNAALVSFAGSPTYHRIATAIDSAGWKVRQMWGWTYQDGMITSAWPKEGFDRLAPALDPIIFATKGKVLLSLKREGTWWQRKESSRGNPSYSDRASSHGATEAVGRWPRSVFEFPRANGGHTDNCGHPNQKPLALMRSIVAKFPGQVLLDPFCGSASTLIAALSLGWDGIGVELSAEYLAIARRRLEHPHAAVPRPGKTEHHPLFGDAP